MLSLRYLLDGSAGALMSTVPYPLLGETARQPVRTTKAQDIAGTGFEHERDLMGTSDARWKIFADSE